MTATIKKRPDALDQALYEYFGYTEFRSGQREVLDQILAGKDVLAVFPTGAGKSLTYQLAALSLPGTAIIVSPLIALMRDQVVDLQSRNIEGVSAINSTLTGQEVTDHLNLLAGGEEKLLYVTPERCSDPEFLEHLERINVSLFVVDEAHCISEWGYDFRPAYLMLDKAIRATRRPPILALTATATPQVRADIQNSLGLIDPLVIIHGFDRANLVFDVMSASTDREKDWQLLKLFGKASSGKAGEAGGYMTSTTLRREIPAGMDGEIAEKIEYLDAPLEGSGLVYVATTAEARRVSALLNEVGLKSAFYHGQMRKSDRDRVQQDWMDEITPIVVATTAFGMGINKANLRYVVHYDLPASLEAYYQEAGRAGRDGLPAKAVLIYDPRDRNIQNFFIGGSVPSETSLRDFWDEIRKLPVARVRPLIAALEQAGGVAILEGNGDNQDMVHFRKTHVIGRRLLLDMKKLQARKQYEQSRLEMMQRYASTRECRRKLLLGYFGEAYDKDNCGSCDNCLKANENTSIRVEARAVPVPTTPFHTGSNVTHRKWGAGTIQTVENNTVTVHFPDVGYKTLALDVVLSAGILAPSFG